MINATLEAKVGKNEVYYSAAPFNQAYDSLKAVNAELISPEKLAKYRAKSDKSSSLWQNGSYVDVGVIYANNQIILVKNGGPVVENAKAATEAHKKGIEYMIEDSVANKYVEFAEKGDESLFVVKDRKNISTGSFDKSDLAIWLFGSKKLAKAYGASLREKGVKEMPLYFDDEAHIKNQKGPYAAQLWLGILDGGSQVSGLGRNLACSSGARGVRSKKTAEGSRAEKLPYTAADVQRVLSNVIGVQEGKCGINKLADVRSLLEKILENK